MLVGLFVVLIIVNFISHVGTYCQLREKVNSMHNLDLYAHKYFFHQSADGRLRLYQCDFLALTAEIVSNKFDAVWDIQSLVSINPRDRKQYVRTLRSDIWKTNQIYKTGFGL